MRSFPSLEAVAAAYLADVSERPTAAALAVAAPVLGESVEFTNSFWAFGMEQLRTALGVQKLLVLNDFEALAYALPHLGPADLHQIGGGTAAEHAAKVLVGPGTGLGVASLVWSSTGWLAMASEGGHVSFAVEDAHRLRLLITASAKLEYVVSQ